MMRTDACATLYTLQHHSLTPSDPEEYSKYLDRIWVLTTLIENFAVEEIEIHHFGGDYVDDCPAHRGSLKHLFPTKDVYGRYGCVACDYFKELGLRHVRCRWTAAHEENNC